MYMLWSWFNVPVQCTLKFEYIYTHTYVTYLTYVIYFTYIHACIHTYIHTYIHTDRHVHVYVSEIRARVFEAQSQYTFLYIYIYIYYIYIYYIFHIVAWFKSYTSAWYEWIHCFGHKQRTISLTHQIAFGKVSQILPWAGWKAEGWMWVFRCFSITSLVSICLFRWKWMDGSWPTSPIPRTFAVALLHRPQQFARLKEKMFCKFCSLSLHLAPWSLATVFW